VILLTLAKERSGQPFTLEGTIAQRIEADSDNRQGAQRSADAYQTEPSVS
jgi:hypothetical protein